MLQKYLDNYDLSIKVIYVLGTLGFSAGTAVMAMFPNVYVAMVTISTMGIVSMSISYCPYALLGHYHEIKEVRPSPGCWGRGGRKVALPDPDCCPSLLPEALRYCLPWSVSGPSSTTGQSCQEASGSTPCRVTPCPASRTPQAQSPALA